MKENQSEEVEKTAPSWRTRSHRAAMSSCGGEMTLRDGLHLRCFAFLLHSFFQPVSSFACGRRLFSHRSVARHKRHGTMREAKGLSKEAEIESREKSKQGQRTAGIKALTSPFLSLFVLSPSFHQEACSGQALDMDMKRTRHGR